MRVCVFEFVSCVSLRVCEFVCACECECVSARLSVQVCQCEWVSA